VPVLSLQCGTRMGTLFGPDIRIPHMGPNNVPKMSSLCGLILGTFFTPRGYLFREPWSLFLRKAARLQLVQQPTVYKWKGAKKKEQLGIGRSQTVQ
jgi:hypothetical protein